MTKKETAERNGKPWNKNDLRVLEAAARRGAPVAITARRLKRTAASTQQKAMRMGYSFR